LPQQTELSAFEHYRQALARRGEKELETLAQIKRFNECLFGDAEFREQLTDNPQGARELARGRGLDLDPEDLAPFWRDGPRPNLKREDLDDFPVARLWADWTGDLLGLRERMRTAGGSAGLNPAFDAWRRRQISRLDSELGNHAASITHSVFAFELSQGCSMGCRFCGVGAEALQGVLAYTPQNRQLWTEVLKKGQELLGGALTTGFCYWATEPTDNPDYLKFIADFHRISGEMPQTTSAAPFKDLAWTRGLLEMHRKHPSVPPRFSVLSTPILRRLHHTFTPRELFGVELVLQTKGSLISRAAAGRNLGAEQEKDTLPGTIACVSGFLVNLVQRRISLISPCQASERWPLGYRVHAEGGFEDADGFGAFIERAIAEQMPRQPDDLPALAWRSDLTYAPLADGFTLENKFKRHTVNGQPFLASMGELINAGRHDAEEIMDRLCQAGADFFGAQASLRDLFDRGRLDEEPAPPEQEQRRAS
jgi:radical SAM family RiPP maturation amino acid epimerase